MTPPKQQGPTGPTTPTPPEQSRTMEKPKPDPQQWKVTIHNRSTDPDNPDYVYQVTGPDLANQDTTEGILLSNRDQAYAIASSRELLKEFHNLVDFYEYSDALSPEVIELAYAVIDKARGIARRKCDTPGCPNPAMADSIQIGPGTNIYVCQTCITVT